MHDFILLSFVIPFQKIYAVSCTHQHINPDWVFGFPVTEVVNALKNLATIAPVCISRLAVSTIDEYHLNFARILDFES